MDRSSAFCLERIETEHKQGIIFSVKKGSRHPLHLGASGKIFLAFLPSDEIETHLKKIKLMKFANGTIIDQKEFRSILAKIKKVGYATSDQEIDLGARAVTAPIFNQEGQIIAGLTIAGPVQRMSKKRIKKLIKFVTEYAIIISNEIKKIGGNAITF